MDDGEASYNYFVDALLGHKIDDLNDIAMYPKSADMDAFIMEFKVRDARCEDSLEQTA